MEQKWTLSSSFVVAAPGDKPVVTSKPAPQIKIAQPQNKVAQIKPAVMPSSTLTYTLEFQYACRKNIKNDSCQGNVYWNGEKIIHVIPQNHDIITKTQKVRVVPGVNTLKFEGEGKSDSFGLTIDNVKLIRDDTKEDLAINGGFEQPDQKGKWNVYDEIPGWKGKGIEIGRGTIYNKAWTSQICELDGHKHGYLSQQWDFNN